MHFPTSQPVVKLASFIEDAFFFLLYGFGFFLKDHMSIGVWVYFWVFNIISFIDLSLSIQNTMQFLLLLFCSRSWSQGWWFPQKFFYCLELFSLSWVFVFTHEVESCSFHVCEKLCWNFYGNCIESVDCCWGKNGIFSYVNIINLWACKIFPCSFISFIRDLRFLS